MNVIKKKTLDGYTARHADTAEPLAGWRKIFERAGFSDIHAMRTVLPTADFADPYTVFNIKGNNYRLITIIHYRISGFISKNFSLMPNMISGTRIAKGANENEHSR